MPRTSLSLLRSAILRLNRLEDRTTPASFELLPIPTGYVSIDPFAVSADGSAVVGQLGKNTTPIQTEPFRWTAASGTVPLGVLPGGGHAHASATSADGSVVVGMSQSTTGWQPFRWTASTGLVELGWSNGFGGGNGWAPPSISADGSVIVGAGDHNGGGEAFRWTAATGMVGLGFLSGGLQSFAAGVSGDGSVVVGSGHTPNGLQAFHWTAATGMVGLTPTAQYSEGRALAVSADGTAVVGWGRDPNTYVQPFRWTAATGTVQLESSGGLITGLATGVSADGSVVVGQADVGYGLQDFYWTAAGGVRGLREVLIDDYGLGSQLAGWTLQSGELSVSADGRVIAGFGSNAAGSGGGYIAKLDPSPPLPTVTAVQVIDGSAQRSMVTSLKVTFSPAVTFGSGINSAFQLNRTGPSGATGAVNFNAVQAGNTVTLTFADGGPVGIDPGGSLADGTYQLTVFGSKVSGAGGQLDGNGDGVGGDDYVLTGSPGTAPNLFRLFGDIDGDGDVDAFDFGQFRSAFGSTSNLTFDSDGDVDAADFGQFRTRFGQSV